MCLSGKEPFEVPSNSLCYRIYETQMKLGKADGAERADETEFGGFRCQQLTNQGTVLLHITIFFLSATVRSNTPSNAARKYGAAVYALSAYAGTCHYKPSCAMP